MNDSPCLARTQKLKAAPSAAWALERTGKTQPVVEHKKNPFRGSEHSAVVELGAEFGSSTG